MVKKKNKSSHFIQQIMLPVMIALIVGSSAPWWWNMLFSGGKKDVEEQIIKPDPIPTPEIKPPAIHKFSAEPRQIKGGQSAELSWQVENATDVVLKPDNIKLPLSGTRVVSPPVSKQYVILARNDKMEKFLETDILVELGPQFNASRLIFRDHYHTDPGIIKASYSKKYDEAFHLTISNRRLTLELTKPFSWGTAYRPLTIPAEDEFLIEAEVKALNPNSTYGIRWEERNPERPQSKNKIDYTFRIYFSRNGKYSMKKEEYPEISSGFFETINLLKPSDVNYMATSSFIKDPLKKHKLSILVSKDSIELFFDGIFLNKVPYSRNPVTKISPFIAGISKVEFHELSVQSN